MPKTIDDERLLTIHQRVEDVEGWIEEGSDAIHVHHVKNMLKDIQDLIDENQDIKRLYARLRSIRGTRAFRRDLEFNKALKDSRRKKSGLSAWNLFLIRHYLQRYPELSLEDIGNRVLGRPIMARQLLDMLYRAGYTIQTQKIRWLVPHFNNRLEPIPIPRTLMEAQAEKDGYDEEHSHRVEIPVTASEGEEEQSPAGEGDDD